MRAKLPVLFPIFMLLLSCFSFAQQGITAVDDSICVMQGQSFNFNVKDNDIFPPGIQSPVLLTTPSSCFGLTTDGHLYFLPGAKDCCGDHVLAYRYENCQPPSKCVAKIKIKVKCPKPDCFFVNMANFAAPDPTGGSQTSCAYACEHSQSTFFIHYDTASTYVWNVVGGTFVPGANPAEILVTWGATGNGTVTLTITNAFNEITVLTACVTILQGPVAAFTKSAAHVCLGAPLSFTNTSSGANASFWNFGDGNTATMFSPTHIYATPGTYTVCLTVTKNNYDEHGNALCCCTDSVCMQVVVDDLKGPDIFCISTLCAQDSSKYWTDAPNCGSYIWTVLDANGNPVPFTGQGNDTISVHWGAGPVGTVQLQVANCDSAYCSLPVSVTVPIIPATVVINGLTKVCENETATYTVPKWNSTYYNWQITGGVLVSGQGTNTVTILWGAAPGPGIINLNYYSSFLGGLPGHESPDCEGLATLSVAIKPRFTVFGVTTVCANTVSSYFATPTPLATYTWSISPAVGFTGQGTNIITVNWNAGPGIYVITAVPTAATAYCNASVTTTVQVEAVPPPQAINGPTQICPGGTDTYFAQSMQTGIGYSWAVTGGTPAIFSGNPLVVTWNPSGPYAISLKQTQLSAPGCMSDTIQLLPVPKLINGPLTITGPGACINSVQNYTGGPAQHPDATYQWTVSPPNIGSVVNGQGTPNIQVQWNNVSGTATLTFTVSLCNQTLTKSLTLPVHAPVVPVITQTGTLCPGVPATLDAGAGFTAYQWSTGANTQTISIMTGGAYTVTTTDANGCTAFATYHAVALPGPTAFITTPDPTVLCINPPNNNTVSIFSIANNNYTFAWYCNGVLQALPPTQDFLVHVNTNVPGSFAYHVIVTDASGCTNISNTIVVVQENCSGNNGCSPQNYNLSFTAVNQTLNCNIVDFTVTASNNVILTGWNFDDPFSNANTGSLPNAVHAYSAAACYKPYVTGLVPALPPDTGFCVVSAFQGVCVPIAAKFSCTVNCQTVTFTDLSTFLTGQNIISWSWNFGDAMVSSLQNPMHTYVSGGTYNVTLTVANANGCQATFVKQVVVPPVPNPVITINPNPACVGVPLSFTATGPGIVSWLWNFNDGSTNGSQNPAHTYLGAGTYTITLTVQDGNGCQNSVNQTITVFPATPNDTISYLPALTICAGSFITLTAPAGTGYTWLWSTGATTQSVLVNMTGTYSVTVTDANGCTLVPKPVTVTILPLPAAYITGNHFICDSGCITLSAPAGPGYTYQWLDQSNNPLTPVQTGMTLSVCSVGLLPAYSVMITDANGCAAVSPLFPVSVAVSPSFSVTVAPDSCEGTPATLSVTPVQPNVVYAWSNGATGISITVLQAGTYVVVGTDTISGCKTSASATIHPLPDLCLVPVGCYEICNPDTVCGPPGLAGYQWNKNGQPIPGATNQCLIVTQSGTYTLTGTTAFGCSLESDSLMLDVINCGCSQLSVSAEASGTDSCCWNISYNNQYGDLIGMVIHSDDADFSINLATVDPALGIYAIGNNSVTLVGNPFNTPLPSGALSDFITICLQNVQQTPQQVIVDWYDFALNIVCSDTLLFNCPVEPDCLYLKSDSIYCEGNQVLFTMTVCNPVDNDFSVGYIEVVPSGPAGIVVSPPFIDDSNNPIPPGACRDYTFTLSGSNLPGELFCFNLIAHESRFTLLDTTLCCSLDTLYCIPIPDCDPCDNVGVETVDTLHTTGEGYCCFNISLFNNYAAGYFDGINLCMLTPNTTMTLNNPFGSGWATVGYTPTLIQLNAVPPLGTSIPLGVVQLPVICTHTNHAPPQLLEIKWMQGDSVRCRDTIQLSCEPPCGYLLDDTVLCNPAGGWVFQGTIKNTSNYTMGLANFAFTSPAGMSAYNVDINMGSLPPGGTYSFSINLGAPGMIGDTVCFTVALHTINDDNLHLHCCNFHDCIVLPDCAIQLKCQCDPQFAAAATKGIVKTSLPAPAYTVVFAPKGNLSPCDTVLWHWTDSPAIERTIGKSTITHTFPGPGNYNICMEAKRVDENGKTCSATSCIDIAYLPYPPIDDLYLFPNPSSGNFLVQTKTVWNAPVHFRLLDVNNRLLKTWTAGDAAGTKLIAVDVSDIAQGFYLIEVESEGRKWVKKLIVQ